jgi:hypothetical protein
VLRCSKGHVFRFRYSWWWGNSFTRFRLGFAWYMRCPVGKHWALLKGVKEADLTEEERQALELLQPFGFYDGAKLNGSIGVFIGLFSLTMSIVTERWWLALGCIVWIALWGALIVAASRRRVT